AASSWLRPSCGMYTALRICRPLPCIQIVSVASATSTDSSTRPLKRGCAGSMVSVRPTSLGTTVRGSGPVGTSAPDAAATAPLAKSRAVASRVRRRRIGDPPMESAETTAAGGAATLTEVLAVDRALQGGGQGGIAVHQVAPGQLDAVAAPLLDQFQAGRVDGQGVGLVFDLDLAAQRLVEGGGHAGSGRMGSRDRKSTRLNSSHVKISYAVFCLKKKNR